MMGGEDNTDEDDADDDDKGGELYDAGDNKGGGLCRTRCSHVQPAPPAHTGSNADIHQECAQVLELNWPVL